MPSVPTLVNVLAGVTEAVALLNGDPDRQAAALRRLEKRQVSLSNPGLLVDLHGWGDTDLGEAPRIETGPGAAAADAVACA